MDSRLGSLLLSRPTTERVRELSEREREILDLLAHGLTGDHEAALARAVPRQVRSELFDE